MVVILTLIYLFSYRNLLGIFTNLSEVLILAEKYSLWVAVYPIIAFIGLVFYGVFTGSAVTAPILYSTAGALVGFLVVWKFGIPVLANNGVWLSLIIFYLLRSVLLLPFLRSITKKWE